MRTAALVRAIVAGLIGLVASACALSVGGLWEVFGNKTGGTVVGLVWTAVGLSVLGIGGGLVAFLFREPEVVEEVAAVRYLPPVGKA